MFELMSSSIFDTGPGAYPSIFGTHNGTITPNQRIAVRTLYTYPCEGTGGHTEYIQIWNSTFNAIAIWSSYGGDLHDIYFDKTFTLVANERYNYTVRTGSYPQIIHVKEINATGGKITCTEFVDANGKKFVDANGKRYDNWIPAIKRE
jgi:hypothetical protein